MNSRRIAYRYFCWAIVLIHFLVSTKVAQGQQTITGQVFGVESDQKEVPLVGANIYWLGTQQGTVSAEEGRFRIATVEGARKLIISYVGFKTDTIAVTGAQDLRIVLQSLNLIDEVTVSKRLKGTRVSTIDPLKTQLMSERELLKAACCNLSESFETNPSVDVAFTDAVTGTRQIQMLGLSGIYTQINIENYPNARGLASSAGLSYIPGPWVKGIQVTKGVGTVANGYESMTGQINVELKKPEEKERLYVNAYANEGSRLEFNSHIATQVNKKWSTGLLVHANTLSRQNDRNKDGFFDMPTSRHVNVLNRWKYEGDGGLRMQFGVMALAYEKQGGQLDFWNNGEDTAQNFGMEITTERLQAFAKIGHVNERKPYQSIGLVLTGVQHTQESFFGQRQYDADEQLLYGNLIFQSILGNTNHKYRAGLSFMYNDIDEQFMDTRYQRTEQVGGAFMEYTYSYLDRFDLILGLRGDQHNLFGGFVTPRVHLRWQPTRNKNTIIRALFGRGQRTANIFAENAAVLASARTIAVLGVEQDKPYGLSPEVSWNSGVSLTYDFVLNYREGSFAIDFHRTDFENQIIVDYDHSPRQLLFYNLIGRSYSNSVQVEWQYEPVRRFDVKMAYRWLDVKADQAGLGLMERPFIAEHRTFLNVAYATKDGWAFDYTINRWGTKRLPDTRSNPEGLQLNERSPAFTTMNAQVSKSFKKKFDLYVGVENITDFRQDNPVLAANDPLGPYFDASMVWGPIFGRMSYVGFRYKLIKNN